mmetsp:Transcript_21088/g.31675  ORF Transcript_21088/g.31675 Transcript_21088/m.31675 type:complete len:437 (+) Transcript_21088:71-1381(+)
MCLRNISTGELIYKCESLCRSIILSPNKKIIHFWTHDSICSYDIQRKNTKMCRCYKNDGKGAACWDDSTVLVPSRAAVFVIDVTIHPKIQFTHTNRVCHSSLSTQSRYYPASSFLAISFCHEGGITVYDSSTKEEMCSKCDEFIFSHCSSNNGQLLACQSYSGVFYYSVDNGSKSSNQNPTIFDIRTDFAFTSFQFLQDDDHILIVTKEESNSIQVFNIHTAALSYVINMPPEKSLKSVCVVFDHDLIAAVTEENDIFFCSTTSSKNGELQNNLTINFSQDEVVKLVTFSGNNMFCCVGPYLRVYYFHKRSGVRTSSTSLYSILLTETEEHSIESFDTRHIAISQYCSSNSRNDKRVVAIGDKRNIIICNFELKEELGTNTSTTCVGKKLCVIAPQTDRGVIKSLLFSPMELDPYRKVPVRDELFLVVSYENILAS